MALKEEVLSMPLGLDTLVGEGGQNISGGQKQRIAIARALLSDTEVVIFDEATSNLDQLTEKKIYDNLRSTNKNANLSLLIDFPLFETRIISMY